MTALEILLGIIIAVIGGRLGLHRLCLFSLAFVAGFASYMATKGFHSRTTDFLSQITSVSNARVISFIVLALPPLFTIPYLGRKLLVRLGITEELSPLVDRILGAFFAAAIYAAILQVI